MTAVVATRDGMKESQPLMEITDSLSLSLSASSRILVLINGYKKSWKQESEQDENRREEKRETVKTCLRKGGGRGMKTRIDIDQESLEKVF